MGNMKPEEFKEKMDLSEEVREQEIRDILQTQSFRKFSLMIKPTRNDYNNSQSINYFAQRVYDFSFKKNNNFLIQKLKAYQKASG